VQAVLDGPVVAVVSAPRVLGHQRPIRVVQEEKALKVRLRHRLTEAAIGCHLKITQKLHRHG
jgi:hypothetical protein